MINTQCTYAHIYNYSAYQIHVIKAWINIITVYVDRKES